MTTILKVTADQLALISGIGADDTLFRFGSIEAFAAKCTSEKTADTITCVIAIVFLLMTVIGIVAMLAEAAAKNGAQ